MSPSTVPWSGCVGYQGVGGHLPSRPGGQVVVRAWSTIDGELAEWARSNEQPCRAAAAFSHHIGDTRRFRWSGARCLQRWLPLRHERRRCLGAQAATLGAWAVVSELVASMAAGSQLIAIELCENLPRGTSNGIEGGHVNRV